MKAKDPELRKIVLMELVKANKNLSIPELSDLTKIPFETIDNILKEPEISRLTDDFKENRATKTGNRETKVYRLKQGLDNLLGVFDYLPERSYQIDLMKTDYFKKNIPLILERLIIISETDEKELSENEKIKGLFDDILKSPVAVNAILKIPPMAVAPEAHQVVEKLRIAMLRNLGLNKALIDQIIKNNDFADDLGGMILYGLYSMTFLDSLQNIDMFKVKSQISEQP